MASGGPNSKVLRDMTNIGRSSNASSSSPLDSLTYCYSAESPDLKRSRPGPGGYQSITFRLPIPDSPFGATQLHLGAHSLTAMGAHSLTQGSQLLSQQVCCVRWVLFYSFFTGSPLSHHADLSVLKPEEPAVATVFVGELDLENMKSITINGEQFTFKEMTKRRWWYGRHSRWRSQGCPTTASIRPDGHAIIRGDCVCIRTFNWASTAGRSARSHLRRRQALPPSCLPPPRTLRWRSAWKSWWKSTLATSTLPF